MNDFATEKFNRLIAPHFEAGFNLARWLTGNDAEARDVLQNAALRAFRFLHTADANKIKAWFLQIVRNAAYTALKSRGEWADVDDTAAADPGPDAETLLVRQSTAHELHAALAALAAPYREILILRELDELRYDEIATVLQIPEGTVMSRLSRARALLKKRLGGRP